MAATDTQAAGERAVGIDVSATTLDVAVHGGRGWQAANAPGGIAALVAAVDALHPTVIVLEATGVYHQAVTSALAAAGLPVVVVNPRQVRDFARSTGQLAKTDRLDAAVLAQFAAVVRPTPRPLPDDALLELRALLERRRQLVEMLTAEKNRLAVARRSVRPSLQRVMRALERALAEAAGGDVDNRTYQNNVTTLAVLKNTYDVVIRIGSDTYLLDALDATGDTAVYGLTVVKLLNSSGAGLAGGSAKYYDGSWHTLGATPASGVAAFAVPGAPRNLLFSMDYAFTRQEKWQNTAAGFSVVFQTKNVEVQLKNSAGALMDSGTVRYYTGAWHDLGPTTGGRVNVELLPANILFGLTHQFVYNEQWQEVGANPTVLFQTKNTVIELRDSGGTLIPDAGGAGAVRYYTGAWHPFAGGVTADGTASMELLPANILFGITHQFAYTEKWQNTAGAPTVLFQTAQVQSASGACTQYYTGAWHPFTNGMELLPVNILFHFNDGTADTWKVLASGVNTIH